LEGFAALFDDLFGTLAQRRGFREYLTGLLAPRDQNKTLTCLAGAEPVVGAQHPAVQRLQFFLSESTWDFEQVNARRLALLLADPATAPHTQGVLVIDDSADRKDGHATAHVGHQWLGRYGKTEGGIVTVTTAWADEHVYYPLHAQPYTPAHHFPKGKADPAFRTKLQIGSALATQARQVGVVFQAVAAEGAYGDHDAFRAELHVARLPFVMALKPHRGSWAYGPEAYTPVDAARALPWNGPEDPGCWIAVTRHFRDGHTSTWWAAEAHLGWWGPDGTTRLVVATTDPARLPEKTTWYLATDLACPGSPREADSPYPAADLAEIVRIYRIRTWIEQGYRQVKDQLGWADFQVRSDTAIRRHQTLVTCAFSFCWGQWFTERLVLERPDARQDRQERGARRSPAPLLATDTPRYPQLADPSDHIATLVAGLVGSAPTCTVASPPRRRRRRTRPTPLSSTLT